MHNQLKIRGVCWRDDPVHVVLQERKDLTVLVAVKVPSSHEPIYHYHDHDSIFVSLMPGKGINENPNIPDPRNQMELHPGQVLAYDLRGPEAIYVHRVHCICTMAFIGVEVRAPLLLPDVPRAETVGLAPLKHTEFATVSQVTVASGETLHLRRKQGRLPLCTLFVPFNGIDRETIDNDNVLFEIDSEIEAAKQVVHHVMQGVHAKFSIIDHSTIHLDKETSYATVSNNEDKSGENWNGVIMDIWGRR